MVTIEIHFFLKAFHSQKNRHLQNSLRSPVRVSEENASLLRMLISLYRLICETAVDLLSGICSTAPTAIQCWRRVIVVEKVEECFSLACDRLEVVATSIQMQLELSVSADVFPNIFGQHICGFYASSINTEGQYKENGEVKFEYD